MGIGSTSKDSGGFSGTTASGTKKTKQFDARLIFRVLYWGAVLAGLWFAYLNIQPYAAFVRQYMGGGDNTLVKLISIIPIVNGVAATIGFAIHWIIGFVLWLVLQTIQLLPIILKRDRAFMRTLIADAANTSKFHINEDDDPTLVALKRWFNNFPALTISRARTWALGSYAVDFLVCFVQFPPCRGGFGNLIFILMTGQWSQLDYYNIVRLFITIYIVELIVKFLFWLGQIAYYMKKAHNSK
ncbi:hypothetical protein [Calothrix sp. NIES-2098]|uniref:hypothetical protein n=1 Tax=Calothrix sp. NIES-2098 TaxID=1954171 RepID=UPI000B6032BE|nr:hypothetical protein NIES2098_42050 [Calothrix sp. NIES-2098]